MVGMRGGGEDRGGALGEGIHRGERAQDSRLKGKTEDPLRVETAMALPLETWPVLP